MSGLELILNGPASSAAGGSNAGRVQNDVGDLCLWSSNQAGIRISAGTGYVGVGKTAAYALDVNGIINFSGALYSGGAPYVNANSQWTTLGSNVVMAAGSNVGIGGVVAPAYPLDVSGGARVQGALRAAAFQDMSGNQLASSWTAFATYPGITFSNAALATLSLGAGGSLASSYLVQGSLVTVKIGMTVGTGASLGASTATWTWTLPVAPVDASGTVIGYATMRSASRTTSINGLACVSASAAGTVMVALNAVDIGVSPTTPFAWSAGDSISLVLTYATTVPQVYTPSAVGPALQVTQVGPLPVALLVGNSNVGLYVSSGGGVGVGQYNVTAGFALDVNGAARFTSNVTAAGLVGCITDSTTTTNSAVAASATALSNVSAVATAALPKGGGTVTGAMSVTGALTILGTLFASNVSVLGAVETVNAYTLYSSNLVLNNVGTGPALSVTQTENIAQPVAAFYAGSNIAMMVTNTGVAIGKSTSSNIYALDVSGSVNATSIYTATGQGFKIAFGTGSYVITGSIPSISGPTGTFVSFGYTFTNPPIVFVTPNSYGGSTSFLFPNAASGSAVTTSGFTPVIVNASSSSAPSGTCYFNWLAMGI